MAKDSSPIFRVSSFYTNELKFPSKWSWWRKISNRVFLVAGEWSVDNHWCPTVHGPETWDPSGETLLAFASSAKWKQVKVFKPNVTTVPYLSKQGSRLIQQRRDSLRGRWSINLKALYRITEKWGLPILYLFATWKHQNVRNYFSLSFTDLFL